MNSKLKKTAKIGLIIITPTVLVLIFIFSVWIYKKYKKKSKQKLEETLKKIELQNPDGQKQK